MLPEREPTVVEWWTEELTVSWLALIVKRYHLQTSIPAPRDFAFAFEGSPRWYRGRQYETRYTQELGHADESVSFVGQSRVVKERLSQLIRNCFFIALDFISKFVHFSKKDA